MTSPKAGPNLHVDADNEPFWDACRAHRLMAQRCNQCQRWRWPPAGVCSWCHSWEHVWLELPTQGRVVTFAVAHRAFLPAFENRVPYVVAEVALDNTDGLVKLLANITQCSWQDVKIGMRVTVDFEQHGDVSVPVFRPVEEGAVTLPAGNATGVSNE